MGRTFGKSGPSERDIQQDLLKTIDCDYKTWKLQWEAGHDETKNTMQRLIANFGKLHDSYS